MRDHLLACGFDYLCTDSVDEAIEALTRDDVTPDFHALPVKYVIFARGVRRRGLATTHAMQEAAVPYYYNQSVGAAFFAGQHFMFVPIETPSIPRRRGGLIILSGVMTFNLPGNSTSPWRKDRVILDLDVDFRKAIQLAPYTPPPAEQFSFSIEQAVPREQIDNPARPSLCLEVDRSGSACSLTSRRRGTMLADGVHLSEEGGADGCEL
jgi:hypothetical protein